MGRTRGGGLSSGPFLKKPDSSSKMRLNHSNTRERRKPAIAHKKYTSLVHNLIDI